MLRSLYSGITGLAVSGTSMSVLGDNLANAQTTGFKRSTPIFQELMGQAIAARTSGNQVGLGATTGAIWRDFSQGALADSNRATDMAIQGEGFFILQNRSTSGEAPTETTGYYTRDGHFDLDSSGYVINPQGYILQGWALDTSGAQGAYGNIQMSRTRLEGSASSEVDISVNLDPNETAHDYYLQSDYFTSTAALVAATADQTVAFSIGTTLFSLTVASGTDFDTFSTNLGTALGSYGTVSQITSGTQVSLRISPARDDWAISVNTDTTDGGIGGAGLDLDNNTATGNAFATGTSTTYDYSTSINVYDGQGNPHSVIIYYRKVAEDTWQWFANTADSTEGIQEGTITFDSTGTLATGDPATATFSFITGTTQDVTIDFSPTGSYGNTTQTGSTFVTYYLGQDGYSPGSLEALEVSGGGVITGHYSNGESMGVAQVALAQFLNSQALTREGGTLMAETRESGEPIINPAEEGGNGSVYGNALEESNVDVAAEFVSMIVAQRSFQANAKVISTSDQMLADLMNLRR